MHPRNSSCLLRILVYFTGIVYFTCISWLEVVRALPVNISTTNAAEINGNQSGDPSSMLTSSEAEYTSLLVSTSASNTTMLVSAYSTEDPMVSQVITSSTPGSTSSTEKISTIGTTTITGITSNTGTPSSTETISTIRSTSTTANGTGPCGATVKGLACKILANHNITLWAQHPSGVPDNAFALNNIRDTCNGHMASRSHYTCPECRRPGAPGGQVCLSETLLRYIYDLGTNGTIHVNEIAGACHHCKSDHYIGRAVDLHNDARSSEYISKCKALGGTPLNEGNHIHCSLHS